MIDQVAKQLQGVLHHGHAGLLMASDSTLHAVMAHRDVPGDLVWKAHAEGRLQLLEAELCLGQITMANKSVADHFRTLIAKRMQRLAQRFGQVHVYSELVTLLCERDNYMDAVRLEELWVQLAHEHRYDLVCGYSMDMFTRSRNARSAERIRRAHDRVIRC